MFRIDDKPQPTIQHPEDIVLRITSTAICGSDLASLSWNGTWNAARANTRA